MEIFWLSETEFRLKSKNATILVGPEGVAIEGMVFSGPGEYESKGVMVEGTTDGTNLIYNITVDGLNIVHLGSNENITKEKLEEVDQTDILLTTNASAVADLEPKIIIPYASDENLDKLIKELGAENIVPLPKLSITRDKLPDEPQIVVLEHGK